MKLRYLIHIACALSLTVLLSCTEKIAPERHKGVAGPFSIEIPLLTNDGQSWTRAHDFNDLSVSKISEIWVGLFDAVDHRLIGFGTTSSIATSTTITIENLFFDDGHPEAYAAAVANYNGVKGRLGDGPAVDLIQLLRHDIASWEDFCNIAVDVASAEAAIGNNAHVLMSGIYQSSATTARDIYVISDDDGLLEPSSDDIAFTLFTYNKDPNTEKAFEKFIDFSTNLGIINGPTHAIRLRPLFSHISIAINLEAPTLSKNEGISWRLCNVPKYVYLIEHANIADCSPYNAGSWQRITPAASDLYVDGYFSMNDFRTVADGIGVDEDVPFDVLKGDAVSGENGTYSFGFWHYENMHWGLPGVDNYAAREATYASSDVFSALCPSATDDFNNKATYFELRVKGTDGKDYDFRVHEGLSSDITNQSGRTEYRDFSTFRNTNYSYSITINSTNSALTRSTSSEDTEFDVAVSVARNGLGN